MFLGGHKVHLFREGRVKAFGGQNCGRNVGGLRYEVLKKQIGEEDHVKANRVEVKVKRPGLTKRWSRWAWSLRGNM